jgi:hypothetical protein
VQLAGNKLECIRQLQGKCTELQLFTQLQCGIRDLKKGRQQHKMVVLWNCDCKCSVMHGDFRGRHIFIRGLPKDQSNRMDRRKNFDIYLKNKNNSQNSFNSYCKITFLSTREKNWYFAV